MASRVGEGGDLGLARQDTCGYLTGPRGWLAAQAGVLDEVPVLLVAGRWLAHADGDPEVWPFDGLVSQYSALAAGVPSSVIPLRTELSYPFVHSIFFADQFRLPWEQSLTWNAEIAAAAARHLAAA